MIKRLLWLNGLAVLSVVFYHATGWGFTAMFWWTDRYQSGSVPNFSQLGSPPYYGLRVVEQLIIYGIPAFLFVSGFFIAFATGRNRETVAWSVVGSRIRTLLIPYVIWSAIIFMLNAALRWFDDPSQKLFETPLTYLQNILFGRAAAPYYYVPLITQLFLMSPLIVPLARKRWKLLLGVSGAIQLSVYLARYAGILGMDTSFVRQILHFSPAWFFPSTIFWFASGVVVGFHLPAFKMWLARWRWWLLGGTAVLGLLAFFEWEYLFKLSGAEWLAPTRTLLDELYSGGFIMAFLAFEKTNIPLSKSLGSLGTKSFGIYLVHAPVLELVSRICYHFFPQVMAYQILFMPLLIISGLALPLLLMAIVNRSPARPFYQYIFG